MWYKLDVLILLGGVEAKKYEFPHQALLGYDTKNGIGWYCGGSLISSNFILTGKALKIQNNWQKILKVFHSS